MHACMHHAGTFIITALQMQKHNVWPQQEYTGPSEAPPPIISS
jgi:hypothetical protein